MQLNRTQLISIQLSSTPLNATDLNRTQFNKLKNCAKINSLASKSNSNDNTLSQKSSNQLQKSQAEPHCADENENSNISETAKNQASTNGSESDFIGVEKHRTKWLYLGGVHEGVNEQ